jgi:GNAT superfamily N-acetyltransferase
MDAAPAGPAAVIWRASAADMAALAGFFAGLSVQTRYLRFFAPVTPGLAMLRRLAGCAGGSVDAVVAVRDGVIIGHAMAVDRPGPRGERTADIGVVVADSWQRQGVGSALVRTLIASARARGVTSLTMDVLPGNRQVLSMIARHWAQPRTGRCADCLTIRVQLPGDQHDSDAGPGTRVAPAAAAGLAAYPFGA